MKGLLFATILLSSAALLTFGSIDMVTDIRREALSYRAAGNQVPRSRGNVRIDQDDSCDSRSLVESVALPFLTATRRSEQNAGRSQYDLSNPTLIDREKRDGLASYDSKSAYYRRQRTITENQMSVNEPKYRDISQKDLDELAFYLGLKEPYRLNYGKRMHSYWSANTGKHNGNLKAEKAKQDVHGIRMRTKFDSSNEYAREVSARKMNDRILGQRNKHSFLLDLLEQPYVISRGKKMNYRVNAEKLSEKKMPWNDDDGDGKAETLEILSKSRKQKDHMDHATVARKNTKSSNDRKALLDRLLSESNLFYVGRGKRTNRSIVAESTESIKYA